MLFIRNLQLCIQKFAKINLVQSTMFQKHKHAFSIIMTNVKNTRKSNCHTKKYKLHLSFYNFLLSTKFSKILRILNPPILPGKNIFKNTSQSLNAPSKKKFCGLFPRNSFSEIVRNSAFFYKNFFDRTKRDLNNLRQNIQLKLNK